MAHLKIQCIDLRHSAHYLFKKKIRCVFLAPKCLNCYVYPKTKSFLCIRQTCTKLSSPSKQRSKLHFYTTTNLNFGIRQKRNRIRKTADAPTHFFRFVTRSTFLLSYFAIRTIQVGRFENAFNFVLARHCAQTRTFLCIIYYTCDDCDSDVSRIFRILR